MNDRLEFEISRIETRVARLIAVCAQARLDRRRALAERDRVLTQNRELKAKIEQVVTRLRRLETDPSENPRP